MNIRNNTLKKIILVISFIIVTGLSNLYAQFSILGETNVTQGLTYSYEISNATNIDYVFNYNISAGDFINEDFASGSHVNFTVNWTGNSLGEIVVIFEDSNYNPYQVTLFVNITGSGNLTPPSCELNLSNENYIHTIIPRIKTNDVTELNDHEKTESVLYYDGLGRPMQSIGIRSGGNREDIVTHIDYDDYGRHSKKFLPYATSNNCGKYKIAAEDGVKAYYYNTTRFNDDFIGLSQSKINPYSEKHLENSPLGRVLEQAAPGADWALDKNNDTDHTIKFDYGTNIASEVRLYSVDLDSDYIPSLSLATNTGNSFYNAGELYKTVTKDENWQPGQTYVNKHTTQEFKNKQGQVVLKRTFSASDVNGNGTIEASEEIVEHDTYYIYDDYGNLTFVLPPKVNTSDGVSTGTNSELSELCYAYRYDQRNRLVEKQIPGKKAESIVYDNLDRPVMTQDTILKTQNKWMVTKYDVFGRVLYTGFHNEDIDRTALQAIFDAKSSVGNYETKISNNGGYKGTGYSNLDFPINIELLTINFYDNYYFNLAQGSSSMTSFGVASTTNVKGLATGSKSRVLQDGVSDLLSKWITTISYYDDKARPIGSYVKNAYQNTYDTTKSKLDFVGKVLELEVTHKKTGVSNDVVTLDKFTYDHMGRMLTQTQTIGTNTELIVSNNYDDLGQLENKKVGGVATAVAEQSQGLQTVDFDYNIRGWLKGINDTSAIGNDLFAFNIGYNQGSNALYNGNISQTSWITANVDDSSLKTYNYTYDALNRIQTAFGVNTNRYNLNGITYDQNGNITKLSRNGHIVANPDSNISTDFGLMDNLSYTYKNNGVSNQLIKVSDLGDSTQGFKDGVNVSTEYVYDENGNMTIDQNKGIDDIEYNHLNLPVMVDIDSPGNVGTISYIYDATGVKQAKIVTKNSINTTTKYAGGFIYKNDNLEFFGQPEGYTTPKDPSNLALGFEYVYQYKDHLGNVRLSYTDADNNGNVNSSEIIEENNYYPFGLKHKGYNNVVNSTNIALKRKFGGKEYQDELGLDWYDITARNYDPAIGRWMNLDPLAEIQVTNSPYNYTFNNPILFNDPTGMIGESTHTDEDGNVVAVSDDGDLGVYKHTGNTQEAKKSVEANYSSTNTSAGGEKMGETWTSLGFADFKAYEDNRTAKPGPGAKIDFNSNWASEQVGTILNENPTLLGYAYKARGEHDWDVKDIARKEGKGIYFGSNLFGKYASARDAGNFAAGAVAQGSIIPNSFSDYGFGTYNASGNSVFGSVGMIAIDLMLYTSSMPGAFQMGGASMSIKANFGEHPLSRAGIEAGKKFIQSKR